MRDRVGYALDHEPNVNPPEYDGKKGYVIDELFFRGLSRRYLWMELKSEEDVDMIVDQIRDLLIGLLDG